MMVAQNKGGVPGEETRESLSPIAITWDCFFLVAAAGFGGLCFASLLCKLVIKIEDPIFQFCVPGILAYVACFKALTACKLRNFPSVHPRRIPEKFIKGVVTGGKLMLIAFCVHALWGTVVTLLSQTLKFYGVGLLQVEEQELVQIIRNQTTNVWHFFSVIALVSFCAPIVEELGFRYFLYRFLKGRMKRRRAMLLASFLFALMHWNLFAFAGLFVVGILLTEAYEQYGNLWPSIIAHGIFNAFSTLGALASMGAL